MQPIQIDYPEFQLWDTHPADKDRLAIINIGDFAVKEVVAGLGLTGNALIDSFGITDPEEIIARQGLLQFLMNNTQKRQELEKACQQIIFNLPADGQEFVEFYKDANPYWNAIQTLINLFNNEENPKRLKVLGNFLKSTLPLSADEAQMADAIRGRVESISRFQGIVSFQIGLKVDDNKKYEISSLGMAESECWGYKLCPHDRIAPTERIEYPTWTHQNWNPLNWFFGWAARGWIDSANLKAEIDSYQTIVYKSLPEDIYKTVRKAVTNMIGKREFHSGRLHNAMMTVHFDYGKNGLMVEVCGIRLREAERNHVCNFFEVHPGFSLADRKKIQKIQNRMKVIAGENRRMMDDYNLLASFEEKKPGFYRGIYNFELPDLDSTYKWMAVKDLCRTSEFSEVFAALEEHRQFVRAQVQNLMAVSHLATQLQKVITWNNLPVCFPKLLSSGHSIDFSSLVPVQLLGNGKGRPEEIRAEMKLNGKAVCITGQHAGGKSVTLQAIATSIWLAQSGLPVFGEDFRLNVKEKIGLLTLERGAGSTIELILEKIKAIMQSIEGQDGRQIVLLLDEVGSATQEEFGYELGEDLLRELSQRGLSLVFNTQILRLARWAQESIGAICFKIDADHKITPGIGDGGMAELRQRIGLDKYLGQRS